MKFTFTTYTKQITDAIKRRNSISAVRDPYGDWNYLLIGVAVILFIVLVIEGFYFYKINRGDVFRVDTTIEASIPVINRTDLNTVNSFYDKKEQKLNEYKNQRPASVDPS